MEIDSYRVLVVDDDDNRAFSTRHLPQLTRAEFEMERVPCLAEATRKIRELKPHCLVLDLELADVCRLEGLQVAAFLVLEAVERLAVGDGIGALPGEAAVQLGLVFQLLTALAGALLLLLFTRVLISLRVERPFGDRDEPTVSWFESLIAAPCPLVATGGVTLRGPPLLASM
jgi:hypothetical protein